MPDPSNDMIDLAFALEGDHLPRDHRRALADALDRVLPWLPGETAAGIHLLNVSAGGGPRALLSGRTRLTLRLRRARATDAAALAGAELRIEGQPLRVGAPQLRELRPYGTLYAHLVAAGDADEAGFLQAVQAELLALDVPCRPICGRHQVVEADRLRGFSLMLDGLSAANALRVMAAGLGPHRRLGCGLFVPHKSAAAVGVPA